MVTIEETKILDRRKRYINMRITVLREEILELTKSRNENLEKLRSSEPKTREVQVDLTSKYIYASERYKDARVELQGIIAERNDIAEKLRD